MRRWMLALTTGTLLLLSGCQGAGSAKGFTDISVAELSNMLESKDFLFVNTHIPYEGEIAGTDAFIPYDELELYADQLPADKDARIVLYCRSGRMSEIAATALVEQGYSNVYELDGGMIAWEEAGLPLIGR
jgi:rhodanese-related sulfurtransferase